MQRDTTVKKTVYYLAPFILIPVIIILLTFAEAAGLIKPADSTLAVQVTFFLFCVMMGNLSPTDKQFDFLIALLVPLSFFFALFIFLFFDEGCDGMPQLSLAHALNPEYYLLWGMPTIGMAVITLAASFRPIRILKRRK